MIVALAYFVKQLMIIKYSRFQIYRSNTIVVDSIGAPIAVKSIDFSWVYVRQKETYICEVEYIVVDVLFHLFRKMFIETGQDITKGEPTQLTLF